ncbi:MAG TPA: hypothetical protein VHS97_04685, partial [Isosphaeraceae bacterium]|nr:hypothetical protein [Isosphaeraceae bacterium]
MAASLLWLVWVTDRALGQSPTGQTQSHASFSAQQSLLNKTRQPSHQTIARTVSARPRADQPPPLPPAAVVSSPATEPSAPPPKRFKVRDEFGNCVVARFHGEFGG